MDNLYKYRDDLARLVQEINLRKTKIAVPSFVSQELADAYQTCRILEEYLWQYFQEDISLPQITEINQKIDIILNRFKEEVLAGLSQEKANFRQNVTQKTSDFKNIFEFSQSENLYLSNMYTRFISENLGHKFENIAAISPKVFIPEIELGIKIKGVDLIIYDRNLLWYTQLKTKKDTLTGSQKDRTISELELHPNRIFAAALDMGGSWTISHKISQAKNIRLLSGSNFWSLIDLNYNMILEKVALV
ncbi:MAG: hypothetical protein SAJ37_11730, partial [Oscillatoria sp. PMC 1068.18]|nr:hypothetical protein [Oscillatoria sp. PMC 1068.18]